MVEISDDIIREAAQGDAEAFGRIYQSFSGLVYQTALRILDNTQDAEEATQDVFVRVFRQLENFRFESSLKTWIYRITINTSLNARKKRARHKDHEAGIPEGMEWEDTKANTGVVEKEEHEQRMNQLLNALNPEQRVCIILRNIEGLSYEEIAQSLDIPINTVRTRLKRAREKLLSIKEEVLKDEVQ